MKPSTVDLVIVNWNAGAQLRALFASLAAHHEGHAGRVIVVDNGSSDGSLAHLPAATDLPFELVVKRNRENRGFAAACNQGARCATAPFLLFLNPDTLLFPGSLATPLAYLADPRKARVGIVGIQLVDEAGVVARSCSRFPTATGFAVHALGLDRTAPFRRYTHKMADWAHDTTREVDHVIGAFYLVRSDLFHALNGFDERFFVYLEDVDLSWRAHRAGYTSVYLTEARAMHVGGGTSRQVFAKRLFYSLRSRLRFAAKHFAAPGRVATSVLTLAVEPCMRLAHAALRRDGADARATLTAYRMLVRDLASPADRGTRS